jgi:hypothetical protein
MKSEIRKFTSKSVFLGKYVCKKKLSMNVYLVEHEGVELALKVIDKKKMLG